MRYIFVSLLLLVLAACGGGGDSVQQPTAKVIIATTGTPPVGKVLVGAGVTIELPAGCTPKLDANGAVDSSVITPSGVMANAATVLTPVVYTPATGTTLGTLSFGLASTAPNGFGGGEFVTVTLQLANGAAPTVASFLPLSGVDVRDASGATVIDMGATVSGVTLQ